MIKWILENKEWLFSGAGISVLVGAFYIVRKFAGRKVSDTDLLDTKGLFTRASKTGERPASNLDILTINREIDLLPPYQRKKARLDYIGIRVVFAGKLLNAYQNQKGQIEIGVQKSSGVYPVVVCEVGGNDYPELKVMHTGTPVTVEGDIRKLDDNFIRLDNVKVKRYA